eukprot:TRINITY_DN11789_c0_g1_i1.p1 TRINITY_DN11789_c0_g1~~TRINITY_DN11789_c0_g1_i1.p1  ORF type:complete len:1126 (+),score=194.58 TRINITY_DN11789_c0_g1_i1:80-3379(+)
MPDGDAGRRGHRGGVRHRRKGADGGGAGGGAGGGGGGGSGGDRGGRDREGHKSRIVSIDGAKPLMLSDHGGGGRSPHRARGGDARSPPRGKPARGRRGGRRRGGDRGGGGGRDADMDSFGDEDEDDDMLHRGGWGAPRERDDYYGYGPRDSHRDPYDDIPHHRMPPPPPPRAAAAAYNDADDDGYGGWTVGRMQSPPGGSPGRGWPARPQSPPDGRWRQGGYHDPRERGDPRDSPPRGGGWGPWGTRSPPRRDDDRYAYGGGVGEWDSHRAQPPPPGRRPPRGPDWPQQRPQRQHGGGDWPQDPPPSRWAARDSADQPPRGAAQGEPGANGGGGAGQWGPGEWRRQSAGAARRVSSDSMPPLYPPSGPASQGPTPPESGNVTPRRRMRAEQASATPPRPIPQWMVDESRSPERIGLREDPADLPGGSIPLPPTRELPQRAAPDPARSVPRGPTPAQAALESAEAEERVCIEWQVFPGKHAVLSLVLDAACHRDWSRLSALLPSERWDNDPCRLALMLAVLRGDPQLAEWVLQCTAFCGLHRAYLLPVQPAQGGPWPPPFSTYLGFLIDSMLRDHGIPRAAPLPEGATILGLAFAALLGALERGEPPRELQRRAEVLQVLIGVPHCQSSEEDDAVASRCCGLFPANCPPRATIDWWAPQLPILRERSRFHPMACRRPLHVLLAALPQVRLWEPAAHRVFPPFFRRQVAALARGLARSPLRLLPLAPVIIPWLSFQMPERPATPPVPVFRFVLDAVGAAGRIDALDASPCILMQFAQRTKTRQPPYAGQRIAASTPGGACRTGIVTGCLRSVDGEPILLWRPHGAAVSETLGVPSEQGLTINPLPQQVSPPPPECDAWLSGICGVLNPVGLPCRRSGNTLTGVLALEAQRRRQMPTAALGPPPQAGPSLRGSVGRMHGGQDLMPAQQPAWSDQPLVPPPAAAAGQPWRAPGVGGGVGGGGGPVRGAPPAAVQPPGTTTVIRVVRATGQGQQQASAGPHHGGAWGQGQRCVQMVNASVWPQRTDIFAVDDASLGIYGCRNGDALRVGSETGMIVGVGQEGALYWLRDGGKGGAECLATAPEELATMNPQLISVPPQPQFGGY